MELIGIIYPLLLPRVVGLIWNRSKWIAVGEGTYTMAFSTDGINWTGLNATTTPASPFGTVNTGYGIAWGKSISTWVALGSTPYISYSTDNGNSWTTSSTPFNSRGTVAAWNRTNWLAVGLDSIYNLASSTNGVTWSGVLNNIFVSANFRGVVWNGNRWVVTSDLLSTSTDGVNWSSNGGAFTEYSVTWTGIPFWFIRMGS